MGYRLNRLDEPVFMAVSKAMLTEFGIHVDWRVVLSISNTNKLTSYPYFRGTKHPLAEKWTEIWLFSIWIFHVE